jgi:hypothetical protein
MPHEFDCLECGRHIVRFAPADAGLAPRFRAADKAPELCAHCLFLPGWREDPRLVAIFDPGAGAGKE